MVKETLILILGDQLSHGLSSLKGADKETSIVLMGELSDETSYVGHHKKKLIFTLSAMRHFAKDLEKNGWSVAYQKLNAARHVNSFTNLVEQTVKKYGIQKVIVTEAGEWRVQRELENLSDKIGVPVSICADDRFICSHEEFDAWAEGRKSLRMEYFYREMRRKTGLLMDDGKPVGDKWNFDTENRKPPKSGMNTPMRLSFAPDAITEDVIVLIKKEFGNNFGDATPFKFAVTAADAQLALDHFVEHCLPSFGDYQDAMLSDEKFLYHGLISFYINIGLLDPLATCKRAEAAYRAGAAPLNAVEGFVRQIIGWREYVRGIYWREGPDYVRHNFFDNDRPLPSFYWTGDTDMACMRACIEQTREEAYAHHIQRLMVTGAFALLAGIDPFDVHEWYLAVYADAYEWVEAPNTIGMSQFADGGILGSKPYAASGAYINRMSDYCKDCRYAVARKVEEDACPFNSLYWDFLVRNRDKLSGNGRLIQMYRNWDRMSDDVKNAYRRRAHDILLALDAGERL